MLVGNLKIENWENWNYANGKIVPYVADTSTWNCYQDRFSFKRLQKRCLTLPTVPAPTRSNSSTDESSSSVPLHSLLYIIRSDVTFKSKFLLMYNWCMINVFEVLNGISVSEWVMMISWRVANASEKATCLHFLISPFVLVWGDVHFQPK